MNVNWLLNLGEVRNVSDLIFMKYARRRLLPLSFYFSFSSRDAALNRILRHYLVAAAPIKHSREFIFEHDFYLFLFF